MISVQTFDTLDQTAAALTERSRFLGGGTLLMRRVNYGDQSFDQLLRTQDQNMADIRLEGNRIRIGSAVTMTGIMTNRDLEFLSPVARSIGGPAIRNMATIGGNLFAPSPFGDFATALLAMDAIVHWDNGRNESMEEFLQQRGNGGGIVAAVSLERPGNDEFRYLKISRVKPKGAAVLTIATCWKRQGGRIGDARLAFGAMGPTPLRAKAAEAALNGATLDEAGIQPALRVVTDGLSPADDALASAWYRREVAPVHLKRLLLQAGHI